MLEVNKYIDFYGIFKDLYTEHADELFNHRYEADHYYKIVEFVDTGCLENFPILRDECELNDRYIHFCFSMDIEQANEDSSYVASATYFITYDRLLQEFIDCEYTQG